MKSLILLLSFIQIPSAFANRKLEQIITVVSHTCGNGDTALLFSCLKTAIISDALQNDIDIKVIKFDSKDHCVQKINDFRKQLQDENLKNFYLTLFASAAESALFTANSFKEKIVNKNKLEELSSELEDLKAARAKPNYLETKYFRRLVGEIHLEADGRRTEIVRFRTALNAATDYLSKTDFKNQSDTVSKLEKLSSELGEILNEVPVDEQQKPIHRHIIEQRIGDIKSKAIDAIEEAHNNLGKSVDIRQMSLRSRIGQIKTQMGEARCAAIQNTSANVAVLLLLYFKDNYEDKILPRILELSPDTAIGKDEFIFLNAIPPNEYCEKIMNNKSLQGVVERRLSLGEFLFNEVRKMSSLPN